MDSEMLENLTTIIQRTNKITRKKYYAFHSAVIMLTHISLTQQRGGKYANSS
jgi:hypothetical protein